MRIAPLLAALALTAALGASAGAQDTTHEPGGLNKVAHDVSKAAKKAGRDTKAEVKRDASAAHRTLERTGNHTKAALAHATGDTTKPAPGHEPGGINKAARQVSHIGKKAGAKAKHAMKHAASSTHRALKKTGREAKAAVKDTTR